MEEKESKGEQREAKGSKRDEVRGKKRFLCVCLFVFVGTCFVFRVFVLSVFCRKRGGLCVFVCREKV